MQQPTSPRQPAANRAKQEKLMEAAAGRDSHAERGNRAAEIHAKEREKEYHGSDSVSFSHREENSGFTGCEQRWDRELP